MGKVAFSTPIDILAIPSGLVIDATSSNSV